MNPLHTPVVSAKWLARNLGQPDICILDATWYLPGETGDAHAEYLDAHIPGAGFFDIDAISDQQTDLPHMLPTAAAFATAVEELGVSSESRVIVYDGKGLFSAARAWWTFRAFGHQAVAVLDGGLPQWRREGGRLESGPVTPAPGRVQARLDESLVRRSRDLLENLETGRAQVIDARGTPRFSGAAAEPRPGLQRGHIPGSLNLPFSGLLDPETGRLLPEEQLRARFEALGVDLQRPIVTTCGSGVTAAVIFLAAEILGARDLSLYDGSWAEWGDPRRGLPVESA